ncbi:MAG TPA: membrane protein insertion efficiency factor YidD [Bacteroidales bacterium]|nr:membrane protein insertion efficiency factor YidD [Bacteroidales bacterium]
MKKIISLIFIGLIRFYKGAISPFLPAACRHIPTCSGYAIEAIQRFGPWHGGLMAANRIARCNPLGTQGFDPVPVIRIHRLHYRRFPSVSRLKGDKNHLPDQRADE